MAFHGGHTPEPLTGAAKYHHLISGGKHIVYEIKLTIIVILGGLIILACVVYILTQCKNRTNPLSKLGKMRKCDSDEESLYDSSSETLQNLLQPENTIRLKIRRDKEFFV